MPVPLLSMHQAFAVYHLSSGRFVVFDNELFYDYNVSVEEC